MAAKRGRIKKKKKVRYSLNYFKFFRTLLLFGLLCFVLYKAVYANFLDPMKSYKAQRLTTAVQESHRAVVIRKEYMVKARAYGKITFDAKDKEWVENGQKILKYVCLKPYDKKMDIIPTKVNPPDEAKVKEDVTAKLDNISKAVNSGYFQTVGEDKSAVIENLSKLPDSKYKSAEKRGNESLQFRYLGDMGCIAGEESVFYSPAKGLLSYSMDGYEEKILIEKIGEIDFETVETVEDIKAEFTVKEESKAVKKYYESGSNVCKIIDDSNCLLAVEEDVAKIGKYKKDSGVNLKIGEEITAAQIMDIYPSSKKDKAIVIFRPVDYIKVFYEQRFLDVEIISEKCYGIGVRGGSLVNKEGVAGVYISDPENKPEFIPVEELGKNGKMTIVKEGYFINRINGRNINVKTLDEGDRILEDGSRWN